MNLAFEPATPADAQTLIDIQIRAFHEDAKIYPNVEIGGPPHYDSVEVMLNDIEKHHCHKIVLDGTIIGGLIIMNRGEGHYHLHIIHIHPNYHNRGIGSQAMTFMEATYPATLWSLDTPAYATRNHHFYHKLGYIKIGEVTEPDGFLLFSYKKYV